MSVGYTIRWRRFDAIVADIPGTSPPTNLRLALSSLLAFPTCGAAMTYHFPTVLTLQISQAGIGRLSDRT